MASTPSIVLFRLLFLIVSSSAAAVQLSANQTALPQCSGSCGNITVPYPFGIGPGCYREGFAVTCNGAKAFISNDLSTMEVLDISILHGEVTVRSNPAYICYNESSETSGNDTFLAASPYVFSDVRNKFTAVGCQTLAFIGGDITGSDFKSGCLAMCDGVDYVTNGSCNGVGCCQTSIPKGLGSSSITFGREINNSAMAGTNPCSYAFLARQDAYEFSSTDLLGDGGFFRRHKEGLPVVLDWAVVNDGEAKSCKEAKLNTSTYACVAKNSVCYDSTNAPGYRCNCSVGYEGNPYLVGGCIDVDECDSKYKSKFPCHGRCSNIPGNYTCSCGKEKNECDANKLPLYQRVLIGVAAGIFFLVVVITWIHLGMEKRKLIRAKQQFFKQNGGIILQQQISSQGIGAFKIFTKEEVEKATNNFDDGRILGRGGYGTVYKGILDDNRVVAIKRSKVMDESQTKEFAREMLILSQINHRNIVKILGCCLEVEVPMLVYEFIRNGTLFHYIHDTSLSAPISLDARMRIAAESADALAYLHSSASPPIVHADVKSANILLDDAYNAKVSDFGASKLAPNDENQLATMVQGTWGYLDPEYMQTCQLTVKSDVYSFGVVLLELLTGKKALYLEGSEKDQKCLAGAFIAAFKEKRVRNIIDPQILNQLEDMELLQEISLLVMRCLSARGDERPTMKDVADELQRLRRYKQHPWVQDNPEQVQNLLHEATTLLDIGALDSVALDSVASYSLEKRMPNIKEGR